MASGKSTERPTDTFKGSKLVAHGGQVIAPMTSSSLLGHCLPYAGSEAHNVMEWASGHMMWGSGEVDS